MTRRQLEVVLDLVKYKGCVHDPDQSIGSTVAMRRRKGKMLFFVERDGELRMGNTVHDSTRVDRRYLSKARMKYERKNSTTAGGVLKGRQGKRLSKKRSSVSMGQNRQGRSKDRRRQDEA